MKLTSGTSWRSAETRPGSAEAQVMAQPGASHSPSVIGPSAANSMKSMGPENARPSTPRCPRPLAQLPRRCGHVVGLF
jgi:hypothetical protein